jgi:hypothetical protein
VCARSDDKLRQRVAGRVSHEMPICFSIISALVPLICATVSNGNPELTRSVIVLCLRV